MFLNNLHRNTAELETTGKLQKQSHFIPWPLLTTHHDRHFLLTVKEKGETRLPRPNGLAMTGTRRETAEENPQ